MHGGGAHGSWRRVSVARSSRALALRVFVKPKNGVRVRVSVLAIYPISESRRSEFGDRTDPTGAHRATPNSAQKCRLPRDRDNPGPQPTHTHVPENKHTCRRRTTSAGAREESSLGQSTQDSSRACVINKLLNRMRSPCSAHRAPRTHDPGTPKKATTLLPKSSAAAEREGAINSRARSRGGAQAPRFPAVFI